MNIEEFRDYCIAKPGTSEEMPFGPEVIVYKVGNKMYASTGIQRVPLTANLKCDPERAIELREQFPEIIPGYHMNKKHWNTVYLEGDLKDLFIKELIDHSYDLVANSLSKKERADHNI